MTILLHEESADYSNTGFGYIGLDVCSQCRRPDHIFVSSAFETTTRCANCWDSFFHFRYELVRIPNAETHSVMAEEHPRCQGCGGFEVETNPNTKFVEAYLADKETLVTVHLRCTAGWSCNGCEVQFASHQHRRWNEPSASILPASFLFTGAVSIDGETYCDRCATDYYEENGGEENFIFCNSCEETVHVHNSSYYDGEQYCDSCIDSHVYTCNDCGLDQWDGNEHDCSDDEDDESLIHNYSYRPTPFFFGKGQYHFGFELEVEAMGNGRYDGATLVQSTLGGHAYLKDDGSLNDGFEIVTHPHTLENYHKEFDWGVLDRLKNRGYRSWNTRTCGLHVHVSRTAFGKGEDPWKFGIDPTLRSQLILQKQAHELRFMKLVYDNQRQVERIAGRSENRYATFEDKGHLVRKLKNGYQSNGRYSAINTENDDTIEVRVFKGSLRKERVLSAVEFVHASVEYTRDIKVTSKNHALSWLKFTGYVADNAELYPNLVTIMSESFAGDNNPDETN